MTPSRQVDLEIRVGDQTHRATFRSPQPVLVRSPESVIAASLVSCMSRGVPISTDEPVSKRLLESLPVIQRTLASWAQKFRVVDIIAETAVKQPGGDRVGMFFSCGVDSWFSFLQRRDEITDLVFIHGYDIEIDNIEARENAARVVREVARETGKNLIEVETDAKRQLFLRAGWRWSNGPALATIAHLVSSRFRTFYVPSSSCMDSLVPWGSHPELDPLWSTEGFEIIHADAVCTRVDKVRRISGDPIVLRTLRVCWEIPNNEYNCGRCEKCLRTMLSLRAAGALCKCATFPPTLTPWNVLRGVEVHKDTRAYIDENLAALHPTRDRWLLFALRLAILFAPLKAAARRAKSRLRIRSRLRGLLHGATRGRAHAGASIVSHHNERKAGRVPSRSRVARGAAETHDGATKDHGT